MLQVYALVTQAECDAALKYVFDWSKRIQMAYAWASSAAGTAQHWKRLPLNKVHRAIIGTHFDQTEPYVLRQLYARRVLRVMSSTGGVFHPKLLVGIRQGDARVLIGSSNFTVGAFTENTEVNVMLAGPSTDEAIQRFIKFIDDQWTDPRALEPDEIWLDAYERSYAARARPARQAAPSTTTSLEGAVDPGQPENKEPLGAPPVVPPTGDIDLGGKLVGNSSNVDVAGSATQSPEFIQGQGIAGIDIIEGGLVKFEDRGQSIVHDYFEAWRQAHSDGYFATPSTKKKGWMLHQVYGCWHPGYYPYVPGGSSLTRSPKVCAPGHDELVRWAHKTGLPLSRCTHCF